MVTPPEGSSLRIWAELKEMKATKNGHPPFIIIFFQEILYARFTFSSKLN